MRVSCKTAIALAFAGVAFTTNPSFAQSDEASIRAAALLKPKIEHAKSECDVLLEESPEPLRYSIVETIEGNKQTWQLIELPCWRAAYNFGSIYFLIAPSGDVERVSFAVPATNIEFSKDETSVKSIAIAGFGTTRTLINAGYDEKKRTITSFAKGRGIGDVFTEGQWKFTAGQFVLVRYVEDPTYNGEVDPVTVLDIDAGIWGYVP